MKRGLIYPECGSVGGGAGDVQRRDGCECDADARVAWILASGAAGYILTRDVGRRAVVSEWFFTSPWGRLFWNPL